MSSQQNALVIPAERANFIVAPVDVPKPGTGQILIKIQSAALNPVDYKIQEIGFFIEKYPAILGFDLAGVVEELGDGVTKFKKGDRV